MQRVINGFYGVTKKLDQWYTRQLSDIDLTQGEWAVIIALAKSAFDTDMGVTPSRLADLTSVAPSSMTHRIDKMAARDLVARKPDPENRTRTYIVLTQAGWDLFSAATKESNVVETDTLSVLSAAERVELARLLEVVIAHLDEVEA